jgi:hypothetical protein
MKDDTRVIPVIAEIKPAVKRTRIKSKRVQHKKNKFRNHINGLWKIWREIYNNGYDKETINTDGFYLNEIQKEIKCCIEDLKGSGESVKGLMIPPKSNANYMANPNTIRKNAHKALKVYEKDKNLKFLLQVFGVTKKEKKQLEYDKIVGYYQKLEHAIAIDDLVEMRFRSNTKQYCKEFKDCANKIQKLGKTLLQKTLF